MKIKELIRGQTSMKRAILLITYTVLLIFALFNVDKLLGTLLSVFSMAAPFFIGIAIAFVVNVFLKFYEEKVFAFLNRRNSKIWNKCRRAVCVVLSFMTLIIILGAIILFVIPELASSLQVLINSAPTYINRLSNEIIKFLQKHNITQEQINSIKIDWPSVLSKVTQVTTDFMGSIFSITASVANGVFTMAMSFIFCMYMLFGKEKLISNLKRLLYAFLPNRIAKRTIEVSALSNRIFSNFVRGQLTESCIWFFLVYIGMNLLQLPYTILISCIVALCSLIPIIGPYISIFTAGFILLLVNPWYTLYYIVFFLILQQIEGNLIYPRVVGTSIGLPPIWVLLSIILCGNLFGILGILLGIPVFSILYTLLRDSTRRRLRAKHLTRDQVMQNTPDKPESEEEPTDPPIQLNKEST